MPISSIQAIPVVDLSSFTLGGDQEERRKAGQALRPVFHDVGFANIIGHGVSDALLQEAFGWAKKLFDFPHKEKMQAPHPATSIPHRGYSPAGLEKVYSRDDLEKDNAEGGEGSSLRKVQDFKESYEVGSEHNPAQPNIWLPQKTLPGYREFSTKLFWELNRAARTILEAISLGLSLPSDEKSGFLQLHSGHNNQLRYLHYPPVETKTIEKKVIGRMPAHQDWSSFTMLFQDDVGGLELEDPHHRGIFLAAKPILGACVVNIGDMLQRFTNGLFPSAMHRVTLSPLQPNSECHEGQGITPARYSIPYFVAPDNDAVVQCLPSCVTSENPLQYKPVKFADYGEYISKYMYSRDGRGKTAGSH